MRSEMNIVAPVLVIQNLPVPRHENRDRVREQNHSGGDCPRSAVQGLVTNAHILQFNGVHQMMKGDMRIATAQACQKRRHKAAECDDGVSTKGAEQEVKPHNIGLYLSNCFGQTENGSWIIKRPAPLHIEAFGLRMILRELIPQNDQVKKRIALQLTSDVESVFAQPARAGRKRRYQADLHLPPARKAADSMCFEENML